MFLVEALLSLVHRCLSLMDLEPVIIGVDGLNVRVVVRNQTSFSILGHRMLNFAFKVI
jgi:hypothetical protein